MPCASLRHTCFRQVGHWSIGYTSAVHPDRRLAGSARTTGERVRRVDAFNALRTLHTEACPPLDVCVSGRPQRLHFSSIAVLATRRRRLQSSVSGAAVISWYFQVRSLGFQRLLAARGTTTETAVWAAVPRGLAIRSRRPNTRLGVEQRRLNRFLQIRQIDFSQWW